MRNSVFFGENWIFALGKALGFLLAGASLLFLLLYFGGSGRGEDAPETELTAYAAAVSTPSEDGIFGNVTIASEDRVSLGLAKLLVNGAPQGDFSQGELTVRVYPDDFLEIDGTAYRRRLQFQVTACSTSIDPADLTIFVVCQGDRQAIGTVKFH